MTGEPTNTRSDPSTPERRGSDLLWTIRTRRSVGRVRPDQPPRELMEQILEAAVCAPNHYRTEPWRFFVLAGDARQALGEVMAASLQNRSPGSSIPPAVLEKERAKPLRAPVVIAVAVVPSQEQHVIEIEEVAAVAAAVENLLLAADALGLAAKWRTGAAATDPDVKRFLGLPEGAHLLAFVYLGYPDAQDRPECGRSAGPHTTWLGWDEGRQAPDAELAASE